MGDFILLNRLFVLQKPERSDSSKVERRSIGTYTKSRKSSKLFPNEASQLGSEPKSTVNTTPTCSIADGMESKKPSVRSTGMNASNASSWIKENAGAGWLLNSRYII